MLTMYHFLYFNFFVMSYQKIFFALVIFAGLLIVGCGKDDPPKAKNNNDLKPGTVTNLDLDKIMKSPYSKLEPDEQKVKLEQECIAFLEMGNALKTSPAIKTLQYLNDLLEQDDPDIYLWKEVSMVKEIFEIANVYGVFTWDDSEKVWTKADSDTEMKFIFPASEQSTSNDATLTVEAENSGISYIYQYKDWDWETQKNVDREEEYYLPQSAVGILTINDEEAAKIELGAEYKDDKKIPVETECTLTTSDGYTYWCKVEKGTKSRIETQLFYKDDLMMEAFFATGAKIDDLIDTEFDEDDIDFKLLEKANGYMKLTDNLVIVYQVDIENLAKEIDQIEADYDQKIDALHEDWEAWEINRSRYVQKGLFGKEKNDKIASATGKYVKATLFSITEKYKIADIIGKSEKDDEYWDDYSWNTSQNKWIGNGQYTKKYDDYTVHSYLKFNDNTLVEASAYFSEGFNNLELKWEDFVDAFER